MERETKKFKTPVDKHEVEIYTYVTGGEKREVNNIFLSGAKFSLDEKEKLRAEDFDASLTTKAQDKTIELLVVSINGNKENILKRVLEMKIDDFESIIDALNEITDDSKKK